MINYDNAFYIKQSFTSDTIVLPYNIVVISIRVTIRYYVDNNNE